MAFVHGLCGDQCADYVADIDPVQWIVFANMRNAGWSRHSAFTSSPLFGWQSTNFVESNSNIMLVTGLRRSSPLDMLKKAMVSAMKGTRSRNKLLQSWKEQGMQLTPYAHKLWAPKKNISGRYTVLSSSDKVYFVSSLVNTNLRRVNLETFTCSCAFNDQFRVPCRYLMAVLKFCDKTNQALAAFDKRYLVSSYATSFKGQSVELVLDGELTPDPTVKASLYYKRSGRHLHRRYMSNGEKGRRKTYVCRMCGKRGHNRATCNGPRNRAHTAPVEFDETILSGGSSNSEAEADSSDDERDVSDSDDDEVDKLCIEFILC